MLKIALFPGSFDPFTKGHENVLEKALKVFDKIYIGIGENSTKSSFFTKSSKIEHIKSIYKNETKIEVVSYSKLTIDLCNELHANFIIRGLRDVKDFEYEKSIAQMNHELSQEVETVFLITDSHLNHINSSIVREIAKNGGIIDRFVTNSQILVNQA